MKISQQEHVAFHSAFDSYAGTFAEKIGAGIEALLTVRKRLKRERKAAEIALAEFHKLGGTPLDSLDAELAKSPKWDRITDMQNAPYIAKSASDKTPDWHRWLVWDGTVNVTGRLYEAITGTVWCGLPLASRALCENMAAMANDKNIILPSRGRP